jgi:hypothetical protein
MPIWKNPDGLTVRSGVDQGLKGARAGVTTGSGKLRELVLTVDLVALGAGGTSFTEDLNNDGVNEAFGDADFSGLNTFLPAGAIIKSQRVINLVTPAGGTNYSVGTFQASGTVDTAAGIRTTAGADGTQIGTQLTANRYVGVVVTGTYTAGKIEVIVEYLVP